MQVRRRGRSVWAPVPLHLQLIRRFADDPDRLALGQMQFFAPGQKSRAGAQDPLVILLHSLLCLVPR
jgi:hypothetical protein